MNMVSAEMRGKQADARRRMSLVIILGAGKRVTSWAGACPTRSTCAWNATRNYREVQPSNRVKKIVHRMERKSDRKCGVRNEGTD